MEDARRIMLQEFYRKNPFVQYLGIELVYVEARRVKLAMRVDGLRHSNAYHAAHGGALMSLSDTAMGAACLAAGKKVVTLEMNINCLRSVEEGAEIYAIGSVIHNGRHTMVTECEIIGKNEKLYAKSRGSFYVIDKFTE